MSALAIFIIVVVGGVCLWWLFSQPSPPTRFQITLENVSSIPYQATAGDQPVHIEPGQKLSFEVLKGEYVTTEALYPDGSVEVKRYTITKPETLLLTHSSAPTNKTQGSQNVTFQNNALFPVLLIEKSRTGGRRWGSEIIPPHTNYTIAFVEQGSTWHVSHPTSENTPISSITVSGHAKRILFDGDNMNVD